MVRKRCSRSFEKNINSVINFRRVTHFRLCLLETQVLLYYYTLVLAYQSISWARFHIPFIALLLYSWTVVPLCFSNPVLSVLRFDCTVLLNLCLYILFYLICLTLYSPNAVPMPCTPVPVPLTYVLMYHCTGMPCCSTDELLHHFIDTDMLYICAFYALLLHYCSHSAHHFPKVGGPS